MFLVRGSFASLCSVAGVLAFSVFLLQSGSGLTFWLFTELAGLCVIPSFFYLSGGRSLESLFNYLVVSGVSSGLMLCCLLWGDYLWFIYLGFLVKFGVFPFFGWVYRLILGCNWLVVWLFSTLGKMPVFYFSYFLSCNPSDSIVCLFSLSFIVGGLAFWVYSVSWRHCWCHMMLVSSSFLLMASFTVPAAGLLSLYGVYVGWGSLAILFLASNQEDSLCLGHGPLMPFMFSWVFISSPLSLSVFYKLVACSAAFSLYFVPFCLWVVYNISEQAFLIKLLMSMSVPSSLRGLGSVL